MANDFYQHSGHPGTRAPRSSALLRAEFAAIEDGFDKLPDVSTANLFSVSDGSALVGKTVAQAKVLLALENVTNTADADKPISTLTQAALDLKADAADVSEVDNTSDADKPISTLTQAALDLKAPLDSPTLTGNPTAPTAGAGDSSTTVATTEFVASGLALKANLASPALTGDPTAPTQPVTDSSTRLATTAHVKANLNLFAGTTAGYQKFPNGIVIQWGADTTHATAGSAKSTNFTLAFTSIMSLVATQYSNASPATNLFRAYNHQTSGFQTIAGVSSLDFKYIAIGFITP